ncbi:MAG: DNA gyrase inhibitor YacG [Nitrospiraceae bacterium]
MTTRCPICRRVRAWEDNPWRPFCSKRCQLLDLGAWAGEAYRVAAKDHNSESEPPPDGQ